MAVKFKFQSDAPQAVVLAACEALLVAGFSCRLLFPHSNRSSLQRIYVLEDGEAGVDSVETILAPFREHVDYVEGSKPRSLLASQA